MKKVLSSFLVAHQVLFNIRFLFQSPKSIRYLVQLLRLRRVRFEKKINGGDLLEVRFFITGDINVHVPASISEVSVKAFMKEVKYHINFIATFLYILVLIPAYIIVIRNIIRNYDRYVGYLYGLI